MSDVNFFTPIYYGNNAKSTEEKALEIFDGYFHFCGKKAVVLHSNKVRGIEEVKLVETKFSAKTLLKSLGIVLSLFTVVIPLFMLTGKAILRFYHTYKVIEPGQDGSSQLDTANAANKHAQGILKNDNSVEVVWNKHKQDHPNNRALAKKVDENVKEESRIPLNDVKLTEIQEKFLNSSENTHWESKFTTEELKRVIGTNASGQPGWLTERLIDAYFELLQKHIDSNGNTNIKFVKNFNNVLATDNYFERVKIFKEQIKLQLSSLNEQTRLIFPIYAVPGGLIGVRQYELDDTDRSGNHWILCEVDCSSSQIKFYNSIGNESYDLNIKRAFKEIRELLVAFAEEPAEKKKYKEFNLVMNNKLIKIDDKSLSDDKLGIISDVKLYSEFPKQETSDDCGVFTCKFAEKIALGHPIDKNAEDLYPDHLKAKGKVREQIAARLMNGAF